jgi:hypothetical protein
MSILIRLLNLTLVAATSVLVLVAKERLHIGAAGYGLLFTCSAVGGLLGSAVGDQLISWFTATWTIPTGLLIEAGTHVALATSRNPYFVGFALFAFRRARRAGEHRRQLIAAAADPAEHAGPCQQHQSANCGWRQRGRRIAGS